MDRLHDTKTVRQRRAARNHVPLGPVLWITVLLASWFLIVEWKMLPDVVTATMGALP
jgi:hypothetical protein